MRRDGALSPVFEFDAHIRYSEVDHRGLLKLPALIDYFQDCSTFQSEALGIGMAWLKEQRRAWVLTHWQIVIDRYPALAEPVSVGTFASAFKGLTASRYFYLRDRTGALTLPCHPSLIRPEDFARMPGFRVVYRGPLAWADRRRPLPAAA